MNEIKLQVVWSIDYWSCELTLKDIRSTLRRRNDTLFGFAIDGSRAFCERNHVKAVFSNQPFPVKRSSMMKHSPGFPRVMRGN